MLDRKPTNQFLPSVGRRKIRPSILCDPSQNAELVTANQAKIIIPTVLEPTEGKLLVD